MAEVKWIKIVVDIFDDEKMLFIEHLPNADSIIVIWFKLLTLGGKINNGGVILFRDNIPYTDDMLATIFRRPIDLVKLSLETFEKFGMIEIINKAITIPNWSKHQSLDQLEGKKEYMKNYMRDYRERQKDLAEGKVNSKTNSKTNSKANVSSLEGDKEEDKREKDIKIKKEKFGEFANVMLSDTEHKKLINLYGEKTIVDFIDKLDMYIESTGKKYKSHHATILNWIKKEPVIKKSSSNNQAMTIDA